MRLEIASDTLLAYGTPHKLSRSVGARSVELLVAAINCFTTPNHDDINIAFAKMAEAPRGSSFKFTNGTTLVWGNIERLIAAQGHVQIADISDAVQQYKLPRDEPPQYVILMDSYKNSHPNEVKIDPSALRILSLVKGKADLTVIEQTEVREVSIKRQESKEVKLGQQSRREEYEFMPRPVELIGGKGLKSIQEGLQKITSIPKNGNRPMVIDDLQWARMSDDNKLLSLIKNNHAAEWQRLVANSMCEAGQQLDRFLGAAFHVDRSLHARNLGVLLSHRLIGGITEGHEEWMTSRLGPFRLDLALDEVTRNTGVTVEWSRRPSRSGKDSWVITATLSGKRYVVCKIEPSFDGAKPHVSQTMGVIYYFQEGSQVRTATDGSVWDLLSAVKR